MKTESIRIILNKYKTNLLSEDDAIKLESSIKILEKIIV